MKKTFFLALATAASVAVAEPPASIDVTNLPGGAKVVEDVVVPVPTEIFRILDKIGPRPGWHEVLRPIGASPLKPQPTREQTATLLGTVIAEGFIAVEAEDAAEVKNIGRSVLTLSDALGVKKFVVPRAKAIMEGADKKDWDSVRRELDKTQHEVQEGMRELNDEAISQLVSLGGWLRGTEALAEVVLQKFNSSKANGVEGAELLHQPVLVDFFLRRLENPKFKGKPLVEKLREGLQQIKPLMGKEGSAISEKSVQEIKAITERLNKAVHAKNP